MKQTSDQEETVEIIHLVNRLKRKILKESEIEKRGYINPALIKKAQKSIDAAKENYKPVVEALLNEISALWETMKTTPDNEENVSLFFRLVSNVQDMGDLFCHPLTASFAESLMNFGKDLQVDNKSHQVIVQAHIDVMRIATREDLMGEDSRKAKDLQAILQQWMRQNKA